MARTKRENTEDILVAAFLSSPNLTAVSRSTGISKTCIYETMDRESFKRKMQAAKNEALQSAVSFLQGNLSRCAATLMEIVEDGSASPQVRINAAQITMAQCRSWTDEVDILNRISKLEAEMEKERGNHGGNSTKAFKP